MLFAVVRFIYKRRKRNSMQRTEKCQSLFIRELEDILHVHGSKIGYDLISKVGMHPEKVNRLKSLLEGKKGFHLLNPEELEEVFFTFEFTSEEQLRLRAAILATSITQTLMNRIDEQNALLAGEEVFPILLVALRERFRRKTGLGATRKRPSIGMSDNEKERDGLTDVLTPILAELDLAMLALYLGQFAFAPNERVRQARQARDRFAAVIEALDKLEQEERERIGRAVWQMWREEASVYLMIVLDMLSDRE